MALAEVVVGRLEELDDPGCREFTIGDGDWPFRGFVVRRGEAVYATRIIARTPATRSTGVRTIS